jgi:hypothetical protein
MHKKGDALTTTLYTVKNINASIGTIEIFWVITRDFLIKVIQFVSDAVEDFNREACAEEMKCKLMFFGRL